MEEKIIPFQETEPIEAGNIYFFYRTAGSGSRHAGTDSVHKFYLVLKPLTRAKFRVLSLMRKGIADTPDSKQPIWGMVDCIEYLQQTDENPWHQAMLFAEDEQPLSLPDALPMARGRYDIVRHKDVHHLAYSVENENQALSFTTRFCFSLEACYAIQIKNPDTKVSIGLTNDMRRKVRFPRDLQERFKQRPFISKDAHEYLDYTGAEFLLIATHNKFAPSKRIEKKSALSPAISSRLLELPFRKLPVHPVTV